MALEIKKLVANYLEGNTTIAEENQLKMYFASEEIAPEMEVYKHLFSYYTAEKTATFEPKLQLPKKQFKRFQMLSIAATIVVFIGLGWFFLKPNKPVNEELGTYKNPEEALIATHKALLMVSKEVNFGMKNANYLKEFEHSKKTVFK